jgi:peptidyl-prolyl cis-trans isomerase SurA
MTPGKRNTRFAREPGPEKERPGCFKKRVLAGFLSAVWTAAALFAVCAVPGAARAETVDRIIAVVNSDVIMLSELEEILKPVYAKVEKSSYSEGEKAEARAKLRENVLQELVERKLADQEIKRLGVKVEEAEVDAAIERTKTERGWSQEDLQKALAAEGLDVAGMRGQMKEQMLRAKLVQLAVSSRIVVTDEDVARYIQEHSGEQPGDKTYHLHNLVMTVPGGSGAKEKELVRGRLERIRERVNAGEPFPEVQARLSVAGLQDGGGDLGPFEAGELTSSLQEVVKDLAPGKCGPVMEAEGGYQIIWLESVKAAEGAPPPAEAKDNAEREVYKEIVNKRYAEWLEGLKKRAYIRIMR